MYHDNRGKFDKFMRDKFDMGLAVPMPGGARENARELHGSEMIPYKYHYDDNTVITKDDGLVQVIKLDGIYFDSFSREQIRDFERNRNTLWRSIANSDITVYVHLIRKKVSRYPEGVGGTWFAKYFNQKWKERYQKNRFYVNEIYISVVRTRFRSGAVGLVDRLFSAFSGISAGVETYEDQVKSLNEATNKIIQVLSDYGPRRLCIQRLPEIEKEVVSKQFAFDEIERFGLECGPFVEYYGDLTAYPANDLIDYLGPEFSEIAGFFHYLVNLEDAKIPVSSSSLDEQISNSYIKSLFWGKVFEIEGASRRHACAVVSMNEWPERTPSKMLDDFLCTQAEFIITQSFAFVDRITADEDLKRNLRVLSQNDSDDMNADQIQSVRKAHRELTSGRTVDGHHHLSVLIHVDSDYDISADSAKDTAERLAQAVSLVDKGFVKLNVKPVREFLGVETFYWSQLPGQSARIIGRRGRISSANFAGFASLHNYATGKIAGNLWGPAIMPFETESGTAYMFNFHRELEGMVAGHTTFSADTGSGKTTILAALITMADKVLPRVFWFDNRQGALVFMESMGGKHFTLSPLGKMQWNPLQLDDTEDNRLFLVDLLSMLRTYNGGTVSTSDLERIHMAIRENYSFTDKKDRRLRNIAWCFGQGEMGAAMSFWHSDGEMAGVFDNEEDVIDFNTCRHYCFEMMQLIVDGVARKELPIMLAYVFHRINLSMDGSPFIIVLEEGQNLVKHEIWQKKIDSFIMQIRRKNGILIFVTPDPKYIYTPAESIKKQSATKIYLPNSEASRNDYIEHLDLTESEFNFVRDTSVEERKFLIRRGNESIRAIFNLSDMPEVIPILSSNDKSIALMREIRAEIGSDDPDQWVPLFLQRAMEKNTHNLRQRA